jgi:hypothetical protein
MSLPVRNPGSRHIGRRVLTRQRLIFLVFGALVLVAGIALTNIVTCVCGLLIVGSFAWDAVPQTPENAHVRTWQWLKRAS